ncbi:MAG: hypothetical protein VKJ06_00635 [Vampirovibrionales bacterium]|nr:hypothetical protein [Vampirovibrionales bacterium]
MFALIPLSEVNATQRPCYQNLASHAPEETFPEAQRDFHQAENTIGGYVISQKPNWWQDRPPAHVKATIDGPFCYINGSRSYLRYCHYAQPGQKGIAYNSSGAKVGEGVFEVNSDPKTRRYQPFTFKILEDLVKNLV